MSSVQDRGATPHIAMLDGLRGAAVLCVLLGHLELAARTTDYTSFVYTSTLERLLFQTMELGWVGVDLFFVLSGFLITGILLQGRGAKATTFFPAFYARRSLRIFPLYYVFLLGYFFVLPIATFPGNHYQFYADHQLYLWTYIANCLRSGPNVFPQYELMHLWTLAIEEQYYLVWPIVVFACGVRGVVTVASALLLAAMAWRTYLVAGDVSPALIYVSTFSRLDGLVLGSLLAVWRHAGADPRIYLWVRRLAWLALCGLGATLLLGGQFLRSEHLNADFSMFRRSVQLLGFPLLAVMFTGVVATSVARDSHSLLQSALRTPLLRLFGRHSYAIYISHPFLFGYGVWSGFGVRAFQQALGMPLLGDIAYIATYCAAALGVGWLLWHVIEKHWLRLKRLFPRPAGASAAPVDAAVPAPALATSDRREHAVSEAS